MHIYQYVYVCVCGHVWMLVSKCMYLCMCVCMHAYMWYHSTCMFSCSTTVDIVARSSVWTASTRQSTVDQTCERPECATCVIRSLYRRRHHSSVHREVYTQRREARGLTVNPGGSQCSWQLTTSYEEILHTGSFNILIFLSFFTLRFTFLLYYVLAATVTVPAYDDDYRAAI